MNVFQLKNAPGTIIDFHSPKGAARAKDSSEQTTKKRLVTVDLDLTAQSFAPNLDVLFGGFDHALKAANARNDGSTKSAAFDWKSYQKLPNLTIKVHNKLGDLVVTFSDAKVKSKPCLRVALGCAKVLMAVVIEVALTEEEIAAVLDYQENDVDIDLIPSQMTTSEVAPATAGPAAEATGKGSKKKGSKKGQTSIALVSNPPDDDGDDADTDPALS